jgi:DNA-binding transcriptional MerR regulator
MIIVYAKGVHCMNDRLFSQGEVYKIFASIPRRTLHYWAQLGLIEWREAHEDRRGAHRLYSLPDLWQIGLMEELAALGTNVTNARNTMKWVRSEYGANRDIPCAAIWGNSSIVLWKNTPPIKPIPVSTDPATFVEPESIISATSEVTGWDRSIILPNDDIGEWVSHIFRASLVTVIINLESIQEKVQRYLELAGLS